MNIEELIVTLQQIKKEKGNMRVKCLKTTSSWITGALISTSVEIVSKESIKVHDMGYLFIGENIEK